jgi:hypothetical protein
MPVTAIVSAAVSVTQTGAPDGGSSRAVQAVGLSALAVANGTGNGQADLAFVDERTLASNTSEEIDLAGVLSSVFGATLTFAEVMTVLVESVSANTTNLTIGNATSNGFVGWFGAAAHTETVKPGGAILHHDPAGWPVTASTGDLLKISNASGASATYRIAILGRSA